MCLGIPMQIVRCEETRALCVNGEEQQWVDISLIGEQPVDSWVLVFLGAAREVMTAEDAQKTRSALNAVQAVMAGEAADLDRLFADLVDREPQLPAHLQKN